MNIFKRVIATVGILAMLTAMLGGCGGKTDTASGSRTASFI